MSPGWLVPPVDGNLCSELRRSQTSGRTFYQALNLGIAVFDFWFGSRPPSLHRWFNMYGTIIRCAKAQPADWTALQ